MLEVLRRVFLYVLAATLIAYVVFLIVGSVFYARAEQKSEIVWVRDQIGPNTHRLSGSVPVPSACTELIQKTEKLSDQLYKLAFTTWDDPNIDCEKGVVKKEFHEIIFAPAVGVHFIATLNGVSIPIIVVPYKP